MFKIGYRTVKTAIGTGAAVFIAQLLGLEFYSSAGILVILCVQNTKRKSLQVSLHRFLACVLSMVFAFCIFETIGYTPLAISVLLLTFIPTAVMFKIQEGIVKLENAFMREDDYYYRYFNMRMQQFEILERMIPLAASLSWTYEQADMIADVVENIGNAISPQSTGVISLRQLQEMRELFRDMPLPATREEFEIRAKLVQLVYEMEQYLLIKSRFKGKDNIKELI